jgi:hypothetical protein
MTGKRAKPRVEPDGALTTLTPRLNRLGTQNSQFWSAVAAEPQLAHSVHIEADIVRLASVTEDHRA